jgi:murein L,D-transpeptidase YafK
MQKSGVTPASKMLIRSYKKEAELEVWKAKPDGRYVHLKTFPICRWSGQLGPKMREGDRQTPEGFYSVVPSAMNPHSSYHLSFDMGYPNTYDRAHGATGGAVMVHGACSSAGCLSMTDAQVEEIYALAYEAFAGGQHSMQFQSLPFRFTAENMAMFRSDPNMPFWKDLKRGADHFEATGTDVDVVVCGGRYVFGAVPAGSSAPDPLSSCPSLVYNPATQAEVDRRGKADEIAVAELVSKGVAPVRFVYRDGGQHPAFVGRFADVSRPDTLVPPALFKVEGLMSYR